MTDRRTIVETPADARASAWRRQGALFGAALLIVAALYFETLFGMARIWATSSTFNHGFLILPLSLTLLWRNRAHILAQSPRAEASGLLALFPAAILWVLAAAAGVQAAEHLALVFLIQALFLTHFGLAAFKRAAFPLFFLVFMVPFGEFLLQPLQDVTAEITVSLLKLSGVPVFLDGIYISVPNGDYVVAEECAGVRFLIASLAIGALFAHLGFRSPWRRAAIVLASAIVPILANGVRAYGIVMLGYWTDNRIAQGVDHIVYGWIFLAFVIAILLGLGRLFSDLDGAPAPASPAPSQGAAKKPSPAWALGVLAIAAIPPLYGRLMETVSAGAARAVPALSAPAAVPPWAMTGSEGDWRPLLAGADETVRQSYRDDGSRVDLTIGYYPGRSEGPEIAHDAGKLSEGWRRMNRGARAVEAGGRALRLVEERLQQGSRERLVWRWMRIDGQETGTALGASLLQARARLLLRRPEGLLIAVSAEYATSPEEARAALAAFLAEAGPPVAFRKNPAS